MKIGLLALVATIVAVGALGAGRVVGGADAETFVAPPLELNTSVDLFIADFDRVLRADSVLYERWKRLNPVEAAEYEQYVETIATNPGSTRPPPLMRTPFGRALVAAASIATRTTPAGAVDAAVDPTGRRGARTGR